jgi:O-antigen ligase
LTHRPILWDAADRAAAEVPLWGYGLEATGDVMSREARYPSDIHREILAPMLSAGNPHNYYRELMLETGVIGLLLFAAAIFAIAHAAWRQRRSPDRDRRVFALALLGITSGLLVHAYFERSLFLGSMSAAIFYWFLVAQALRENEPVPAFPAPADRT